MSNIRTYSFKVGSGSSTQYARGSKVISITIVNTTTTTTTLNIRLYREASSILESYNLIGEDFELKDGEMIVYRPELYVGANEYIQIDASIADNLHCTILTQNVT